ncbi:MAG: hypothetical protein KGY67_06240, partial [Candidatus Thermoplasmatota archaeon]|nr:hypothetical protein [Candidatus Thermoplasmatota archaeon]
MGKDCSKDVDSFPPFRKGSSQQYDKFFLLCLILLLGFFLIPLTTASTMMIEVLPPQPTSGQNFTVSVYDPTIMGDTPYLTDVTIIFQNESYLITDELPNRELILSAPTVQYPTSCIIKAKKNSYNDTNTSIRIVPTSSSPAHLVITLIDDKTIVSDEFFTLKITDEYNTPIQNAMVSIQNVQKENSDGLTNETGFIQLQAPNQQEITILAQKESYQDDTLSLWIETKQDTTTALLSNPMVPVFIAFSILIAAIIFVSIKNKKSINNKKIKKLNKTKPSKSIPQSKNKDIIPQITNKDHASEPPPSSQKTLSTQFSKIEEINITKPQPKRKTIQIQSKNKKENKLSQQNSFQKQSKHHWFNSSNSLESQVDEILSKNESKIKKNDWFEGTDSQRDVIDITIKQKQKK